MYVPIMGELTYVLAVDLKFLSAHSISRPGVCAYWLGCLRAARSEGVEEFVLSFRGVRGDRGWWASILLFQVIPLAQSVLRCCGVPYWPTYLYTCVLRSKIDCAVEGRVCDAEDVSDIVGRPEGVEVTEGRCAPDLKCQPLNLCKAMVCVHLQLDLLH